MYEYSHSECCSSELSAFCDFYSQRPYVTSLQPPVQCVGMSAASSCAAADQSIAEHRFAEYNFSSLQRCHLCDKFLYGLMRQGLQCRECGMCCHRFCSATRPTECSVPSLERLRRPSFTQNTVFGAELGEELGKGHEEAPLVVAKCVEEIEKWCQEHESEALSVYRISSKTGEVNNIKAAFNLSEPVNLSNYNVHCIAGALKKYLRELPNPLIPVEYYSQFIEAQRSGSDMTKTLVDQLPPAHKSTLRYLMAHFTRLWRIQHESGVEDGLDKLSHVFCHILLRPPWEKIIEIVENTKLHIDIFEELLRNGNWGEAPPPSPPPIPTRPNLNVAKDSLPPTMCPLEQLKESEWYWGTVSREEVNELLGDKPDGSFLVRDATSPGDYTLTLRKAGSNKLIKIIHKDNKYGFVEPMNFDSVVELIQYYTHNSLAIYNRTLDIKLTHPVCRNMGHPDVEYGEEFVNQEKKHLIEVNQEYLDKTAMYDRLYDTHSKTSQELQLKHQALDAFKETVTVFEEQMELHQRMHKDASPHEIQKLHENYELLKNRAMSIYESKSNLEVDITRKTSHNRTFISDMNSLKPEIKRLYKQREQVKKWLQSHGGVPTEELDNMLDDQESQKESYPDVIAGYQDDQLLHHNQNNWYVDCDRDCAMQLLEGKPDGTFLVRPKKEEGNVFVLSIVFQGKVGHCKIHHHPTGYGFADPFFNHRTLKQLVLHYQKESLAEHNKDLDIKLLYPVYDQTQNEALYLRMNSNSLRMTNH